MQPILYVGFVVFGLLALVFFGGANGAIHEGVAAIILLCSITCLVGAGIIGWLERIHEELQRPAAPPPMPSRLPSTPPAMAPIDDPASHGSGRVLVIFAVIAVLTIGAVIVVKIRSAGYGLWFER